jgi:acyl-CoA synthetase (AMP-forming)/AMP-acid ligase II
MSESNAVHAALAGDDLLRRPGSVGRPLPGCEVRITDPVTGKVVPTGTMGIIELKGYTVMKCYVDEPEATAAALSQDGWLNSGDMGMLDEEGCLSLMDRAKDIIIRGGENVSGRTRERERTRLDSIADDLQIASAEVENAISEDDRIYEVAAVAVPCPLMGERVGVAVSLAPGASADEQDIMRVVAPRLRAPARPVIVWVSPEPLPRNANGKVLKNEVKAIVQDIWKRENRVEQFLRRSVQAKL